MNTDDTPDMQSRRFGAALRSEFAQIAAAEIDLSGSRCVVHAGDATALPFARDAHLSALYFQRYESALDAHLASLYLVSYEAARSRSIMARKIRRMLRQHF